MIKLTEIHQSKMNSIIEEGKAISMLAIKDFVPGSAIGAVTVGIQSVYSIITCPAQFKTNGQWDVTKLNRLMPALGKNKKDGYKYNRHVLKDFKVEKKDKYSRKNSINRINSNCMLAFLEEIKIIDVTSMKDTDMFFLVKDFDQIGQAFAEAAVDVQKDKSKTFSFSLNHFVNQDDVVLEYRCFKAKSVKVGRKDNSFKIKKDYSPEKVIKDYMGLVGNTIANVSEKVLNDKIKPLLDAADKLAFKEGTAKAAANRKDDNGRKILESIFIAIKTYESAVAELDKPSKIKMARLYRELIYSIVGNNSVIAWALAACHCFVGTNGIISIGRNMANINLVMEILPKEFIYHLCGEEALKLHVSYSNVELLEGAEFFVNNGQCFDYDEDGRPVKIFLEEDYTGPVIVKAGIFPMYPEDVLIGDLNSREAIIITSPIVYDKYTGKVGEQFEYNIEAMQNKVCKETIGFNKEANEIVSRDNQGVETVLGKKLLIKKGAGTNVTCRMIDYCEFGAVLFIKTE